MADPACPDDGRWCTLVHNITHNQTLAQAADWLIARPLSIIVLIIAAVIVRWLLHRIITRVTRSIAEGTLPGVAHEAVQKMMVESNEHVLERRRQRAETMGSLLKSITTAVIVTIVIFMVVSLLGYNIAPLLASAGILGVALGFGAQSLVKDFLSGIFLILEDQYGVGDVVNLGTTTGTIEAVTLRVTRLRDVEGTTWYVRNGEILAVGNMSRIWGRVVLDVPVALDADLDQVRTVLLDVAHELAADAAYEVLEEPEVWGVDRWDADGIIMRIVLKTAAAQRTGVAREMRARIKARFDSEGIETPMRQVRVAESADTGDASGTAAGAGGAAAAGATAAAVRDAEASDDFST